MPSFTYRAYGGRGEFAEGRIEAASPDAASEMLWAQGLTPFHMKAAGAEAERVVAARGLYAQPLIARATRLFHARLRHAQQRGDSARRRVAHRFRTGALARHAGCDREPAR
jgi:hypothetical protein